MSTPRHAIVTVTFNPDLAVLRRQLEQLGSPAVVVVVDNASGNADAVEHAVSALSRALLIRNPENVGLAAALNAGAREALARVPDCEYLLFLDQDTEPAAGDVARLVEAVAAVRASDPRTGLAGPLMIDAATGLSHGIHQIRGWRWTRRFPGRSAVGALACASVNGSGMVVPVSVYRQLGGFEADLFVDHVDTEWSFRVAAAGYHLYTVPQIRFAHRMGASSLRFWFGRWRVWPRRGPRRHYFLFRNAVRLMRRPYVPAVWKAWGVAKLAVTLLVHAAVGPERVSQCRAMATAIRDGLRT